jgi:hypothetical protein
MKRRAWAPRKVGPGETPAPAGDGSMCFPPGLQMGRHKEIEALRDRQGNLP